MNGLLLLDVDGVLNPFNASRNWLDKSPYRKYNITVDMNTYPVWLNRSHGDKLLGLARDIGYELVWCTTWEDHANVKIGPKIGLPELPVINFGWEAHKWKFNAVLDYASGRDILWLDDDFSKFKAERDWFLKYRKGATNLWNVDSSVGLTDEDFINIRLHLGKNDD